jgi:hypothetical protein
MAGRIWDLYHLRGNPFFQEPLGGDLAPTTDETGELFVGRAVELERALREVTHSSRTRAVVLGEAGVGKTTFLNRLRDELDDPSRKPRLITHTPAIRIQGGWNSVDFCAEILRTILLMRATRRPRVLGSTRLAVVADALRVAGRAITVPDFWDRVTQAVEGRHILGVSMQAGGGGPLANVQGGVGVTPVWAPPTIPPATLLPVTLHAIRVASEELGGELVFFLNNLENLSRADARHAAGLFVDVRDLFLADSAHWVVCGTTDIDRLILRATPQVDGIFPAALELEPLSAADVADLLRRRYNAMRRGTAKVIPPITPEDGATLYGLYHGNLRSFLKLLQDAVLAGAGPGGARSLTTDRVLALMGRQHLRAVTDGMGHTAWGYLVATVLGPTPQAPMWGAFRQVDAAARTGRKAPVIKPHFDAWIETGAITALEEPPIGHGTGGGGKWYRVSGNAATALAAIALNGGRDVTPLIDGNVGSTASETTLAAARHAPAPQRLPAPSRGRKRL